MANTILMTDVTKLKFDFQTTKGSVIISYPGVDSFTVSGWRQWYTHTSGGNLYFVDAPIGGGATTTVVTEPNNIDLTASLTNSSGLISFIGNGDARPTGVFNVNITNESTPPSAYVNVNINSTSFVVTKS